MSKTNANPSNLQQQASVNKARARRFAMQALYSWLMTGNPLAEIREETYQREADKSFDHDFFDTLINGVESHQQKLETALTPYLDRPIKQLDTVVYAILMLGAYELMDLATPNKVVINEAVILGKKFAGEDSYKYINGVLDKLNKQLP